MQARQSFGAILAIVSASCTTATTTVVASPPAALMAVGCTNPSYPINSALPAQFAVKVTDSAGAPVAGVQVAWSVVSGGGSVAPATSTTDSTGRATTTFTLGSVVGAQAVRATVTALATFATFAPIGTSLAPVSAITLVSSTPTPTGATYAHDSYVRDGLAFAFMWNAGVRIYDVGNGMACGSAANPVLVSSLITNLNGVSFAGVHNGWWFHNPVSGQNKYLFIGQEGPGSVGSSSSGDIHIVDVSNLASPVEVGFIHVAGAGVHNFWMDEANQVLYAAYYNAGVVKIDVSGTLSGDMSSRIMTQVKPGGSGNTYIWGVMLANGTLYATDMLSGFWALDPVTLATKGGGGNVPERYGSDQWVAGQYGYSGTWGTRATRGNAIKIWALGANGAPTLADSLIIANITTVSDVAVTADGKMLIATAEGGTGQGLYVYNRTNPAKPVLVASYFTTQGEHTGEVAVINGRTYVFCSRDPNVQQLDIFDITGLVP